MNWQTEPPESDVELENIHEVGILIYASLERICVKADANWSRNTGDRAKYYAEYRKSAHWLAVSRAAKWRARYRCQVCNADDKPLDTHHRTYERIGCEQNDDLIVLCRDCHDIFHKNRKLAR